MKYIIIILSLTLSLTSCVKETTQPTPVPSAHHDYAYVNEKEFNSLYDELAQCGLWNREQLLQVIPIGESSEVLKLSPEEKYAILMRTLDVAGNRNEDVIVTISSKPSGNANINGGKETWNCNTSLLAYTISQLGQPCPLKSPINYYKTGTSATSIGISDISRAANGYSLNLAVPEIENVDFVNQYSGLDNWSVDVTLSYNGELYIFSDALMESGFEVPGVNVNYSLIFYPTPGVDGAYSMVGAGLPAGITELIGTGWIPPSE